MNRSKLISSLLAALIAALILAAPAAAQSGVMVTTTANLRLRSAPTSGRILATLPAGTSYPATGRNANATWVQLDANGLSGWSSATYLIASAELATLPVVEDTTSANPPSANPPSTDPGLSATPIANLRLRAGPSTSNASLAIIPRGTRVPVLGRSVNGLWAAVSYQGQSGWILASWASLSANLNNAEILRDLDELQASPQAAADNPPAPTVNTSALLTYDSATLRSIFLRGQALGRQANRFSKISDGEGFNGHYLVGYESGDYALGDYAGLEGVIQTFAGSWLHMGPGVQPNMQIQDLFIREWRDPALCQPDEGPVACEVRTWQPAFALIYVRSKGWTVDFRTAYEPQLRELCDYLISQGVIPVLSTLPPIPYSEDVMNPAIRRVAADLNLPLWDFAASAAALPRQGLADDYVHLSKNDADSSIVLDAASLSTYGVALRNQQTLEVLQTLNRALGQP